MYPYSYEENFINQSMSQFLPEPFDQQNSAQMIPSQFGGPGMPPFGGQNQPPFGGPGMPPFGGQNQPPFGGPGMPPFGGQNQPPFGGSGMPPFGGQNQPPFGGPGMPPFGGPNQPPYGGPGTSPMGPPPSFTPMMSSSQYGSSGIRQCLYRNTFIWLRNREGFWFFPTLVSRNVILGFRWGRFGWVFSTVNRDNILTFQCF